MMNAVSKNVVYYHGASQELGQQMGPPAPQVAMPSSQQMWSVPLDHPQAQHAPRLVMCEAGEVPQQLPRGAQVPPQQQQAQISSQQHQVQLSAQYQMHPQQQLYCWPPHPTDPTQRQPLATSVGNHHEAPPALQMVFSGMSPEQLKQYESHQCMPQQYTCTAQPNFISVDP